MTNVTMCEHDPSIAMDTADFVERHGHKVCGMFESALFHFDVKDHALTA